MLRKCDMSSMFDSANKTNTVVYQTTAQSQLNNINDRNGHIEQTALQRIKLFHCTDINVWIIIDFMRACGILLCYVTSCAWSSSVEFGISQDTMIWVSQEGKTNLDLLEQEIVSGSGISWAICKSAPLPRHITMPLSFLWAR